MQSHGGNVELLGVTDQGAVRLRLEGSCQGCPSSRVTLRYAVQEAIYAAAPDVTAIETEGAVELPNSGASNFIPMEQLLDTAPAPHSNGDGWTFVEGLASLHEGMRRVVDLQGLPVLFCRVGENLYAYANTCPNCGQPWGEGKLAGRELVCATCGHHYDVMRAGRDLDAHDLHLEPVPLLERDGEVKVALPALQV